ncbi:MAG: selA [Deltaproteobacteria bacterium]|nr:selA [Deltaproteobacteria bacterium]
MEPGDRQRYLRALPKVDELFLLPSLQSLLKDHSKFLIVESIRRAVDRRRQAILKAADPPQVPAVEMPPEKWADAVKEELAEVLRPSLRPVINATGVVLHTNLGRAPLAAEVLQHIVETAQGYSNLEFDLTTGERGSRYEHVEEILCRLSGAESALAVNNNAGAVLLSLNTLAEGREVIVSRGQLVEIGGSFRIPDVMKKSGARLVEVGTTNRTHLRDYEQALGDKTALLLRVHTSNYRILGFTAEVPLRELVTLGSSKNLPVMDDLGSGCLIDLSRFGLEPEPTVQEAIQAGADVVTFSGDKLLGGPQAGMIVGKKRYLDPIKKNPLTRALRIDKLTLAGLESTLRLYLEGDQALSRLPTFRMLTGSMGNLERRSKRFLKILSKEVGALCRLRLKDDSSQVGGGALPIQELPTKVLALFPAKLSAADLEKRLRNGEPPVVVRIKENEVLLDLRTVAKEEERLLIKALKDALSY